MKFKKILSAVIAACLISGSLLPTSALAVTLEGKGIRTEAEYSLPALPAGSLQQYYENKLYGLEGSDGSLEGSDGANSSKNEYFINMGLSQTEISQMKAAVSDIVKEIDDSWSDLNKILYVNDYMAVNAQYDLTYSKYSAYNNLVEHTSVCQGYAEAFYLIMDRLGIDCKIISSSALNHAWNLVKLNGSWYHIDVTWNDPITDKAGRSCHNYFLVSDAYMREHGHNASDWIFSFEEGATAAGYATSTYYDSMFWQDVMHAIPFVGDEYYFVSPKLKAVLAADDTPNDVCAELIDLSGYSWPVFDQPGWTWTGSFSNVCIIDGRLYFNTPTEIKSCDTNGGNIATEYKLTAAEQANGYIYQLYLKNKITICYGVGKAPDSSDSETVFKTLSVGGKKIKGFVERLYTTLLKRASDSAGMEDWANKLMSGVSAADVSSGFVMSKELADKKLSNTEFVTRMYRTFLGREPDAAGLSDWVKALDGGCSYGFILNSFVGSQEFGNICKEAGINAGSYKSSETRDENRNLTAFISRLYTKALGRSYDTAGLNDWTNRYLHRNVPIDEIAYGFIFSQEFIDKNLSDRDYVETLYATFFDRHSDEAGMNDWLGRMSKGYSRKQVLYGFLGSQECINLVKSFKI